MTIQRYQRKRVEVEAVQWTGENWDEVAEMVGPNFAQTFETFAIVGHWIVREGNSAITVSPEDFLATYELVERGEGERSLTDRVWDCLFAVTHAADNAADDSDSNALRQLEAALKEVACRCPIQLSEAPHA